MSEEKNEALEQKEEVKEETLEDNAKENEDAQVDEASYPGAGKDKEPMKKAPEKAKETGVNNEVPDGPKPDFTKGVPTAKKRPADKGKVSESASKMSLIKSIYDKLDEMSKEEVAEILGALNEVDDVEFDEEGNEIVSENKETKEVVAREEFNLESDVQALIEGEELSDEFKEKAATIFEAAVFARVNDEISTRIDKLDEQYKTELQEAIENNRTVMIEKVDDFMNYVVKEWMQENELAVDKGIRSEIVEDFMVGLKNLFVEHYVDIPDEKVDLVDDLFAKVEDLEGSLNSEIQKNIDSSKELKEFKKMDALYTVSEGMTEVDQEKMIKLAEGIEYENEESYTEKLQIIKDKYFRAEDAEDKQVLSEDTQDDMEPNEENSSDTAMAEAPEHIRTYADAISRTIIK
jgi:hypothetical protein